MSVNRRTVEASPAQVWEVLADGWLYPVWVVGASRMRQVEDHWPAVGAKLHHSVGVWPLLIDDETVVLESTPDRLLKLRAKGWPLGEADVTVRLRPSGAGTEIEIQEEPVSGPGRLVPSPLHDPVLAWRNTETLNRLCYLAERRVQGQDETAP